MLIECEDFLRWKFNPSKWNRGGGERHKSCKLNGIANMENVHANRTAYADISMSYFRPALGCKLFMNENDDGVCQS